MASTVLLLLLAIACEVTATGLLKASDGCSRLWPTVGMAIGYLIALFLLSYVLQRFPMGPVYAVWAGLGTTGVTLIGIYVYKDHVPPPAWAGIGLIILGLVVLGYFTPHHPPETAASASISTQGSRADDTDTPSR